MNVYLDIVNAIYTKTTDIDGTHFSDPFEFLEIKHSAAKFKGKVFYENIKSASVKHWGATIKKRAGENVSDDCNSLNNYCNEKIAEYEQRPERKKTIPIITSENFVNPPLGVDIVGLTEPEAYKKFLELQDAGWEKDPLAGKQYYDWVINRATLEKDNYILAYKIYGLDQKKINNLDIQINRAKNRLKAIEQIIHDAGLDKVTENSIVIKKEAENEKPELPVTLDIFFDNISRYKFFLELLVKLDYCQPGTYIWKDERNGNKSFLAAILKYLHKQGYLKGNKKLTNQQIQLIAENTFGWNIGLDTIKKAKSENFDLKFIPIASTID